MEPAPSAAALYFSSEVLACIEVWLTRWSAGATSDIVKVHTLMQQHSFAPMLVPRTHTLIWRHLVTSWRIFLTTSSSDTEPCTMISSTAMKSLKPEVPASS